MKSSPHRIDILEILNSSGSKTYPELKSQSGFDTEKKRRKFAYHLKKLLNQSLVAFNKSESRWKITNLGKTVLSLARMLKSNPENS